MDDLISRAAAIEYLMTNMGWHDDDGYAVDDADEKRAIITDLVNGIPAVDAVPVVHGRWVKMTGMMPPEYHGHYECSECQWHMKGLRNSWTREEELSYCPNCGAKMDGERRDEDAAR